MRHWRAVFDHHAGWHRGVQARRADCASRPARLAVHLLRCTVAMRDSAPGVWYAFVPSGGRRHLVEADHLPWRGTVSVASAGFDGHTARAARSATVSDVEKVPSGRACATSVGAKTARPAALDERYQSIEPRRGAVGALGQGLRVTSFPACRSGRHRCTGSAARARRASSTRWSRPCRSRSNRPRRA